MVSIHLYDPEDLHPLPTKELEHAPANLGQPPRIMLMTDGTTSLPDTAIQLYGSSYTANSTGDCVISSELTGAFRIRHDARCQA